MNSLLSALDSDAMSDVLPPGLPGYDGMRLGIVSPSHPLSLKFPLPEFLMAVTGKETETLAMELLTCSRLDPLVVGLNRAVGTASPFST